MTRWLALVGAGVLACTGPNRLEELLTGAPLICERYREKILSCCRRFDGVADASPPSGYVPQLCRDVREVSAGLRGEAWKTCPLETARNDEFLPCEIINFDATLFDPSNPGSARAVASHRVTLDLAELSGPRGSAVKQLVARARVRPLGFHAELELDDGETACEASRYDVTAEAPVLPPVAGSAGTLQVYGLSGAGRNGIPNPVQCRRGLFDSLIDRWAYFCDAPASIPDTARFLGPGDRTTLRGINEDTTGFLVVAVGDFLIDYTLPPSPDLPGQPAHAPFEAVFPARLPERGKDLTVSVQCFGTTCPPELHMAVRSTDRPDEFTTPAQFAEVDCVVRGGGGRVTIPAAAMDLVRSTAWRTITVQVWQAHRPPGALPEDDRGTQISYGAGLGAFTQFQKMQGPDQ